jgi:hypothetical protein
MGFIIHIKDRNTYKLEKDIHSLFYELYSGAINATKFRDQFKDLSFLKNGKTLLCWWKKEAPRQLNELNYRVVK